MLRWRRWLRAFPLRSSPLWQGCSSRFLRCLVTIGSSTTCARSRSSWIILRKSWFPRWKQNISKRNNFMRRFSQRSHLVTLSEINITPLLDLAFVLLIIFVITTPLLEQSISLKLPAGGKPDKPISKSDIKTVEIAPQGSYSLDRRRMTLAQIERELVGAFKANPN